MNCEEWPLYKEEDDINCKRCKAYDDTVECSRRIYQSTCIRLDEEEIDPCDGCEVYKEDWRDCHIRLAGGKCYYKRKPL